jgi:WD40 repeat protein
MYPIIRERESCALSADGRLALSPRLKGLCLWDTVSGKILTSLAYGTGKEMRGFSLTADGQQALFVSKEGEILQLLDIKRDHILWTLEGHTKNVDNWALSADGRRVLVAFEDGTMQVWNTDGRRWQPTLEGHTGVVPMCALSANGRLALSASIDRTLRLWNTDNGQEITRWTHDTQLYSCSLSADGRVAVAGDIEGGVHFLEVMNVTRTEDIAAAKLPVSWLAEKSQGKPDLLRRLFSKNEAERKEGEVDKQRNAERESPAEQT